ncbi:molecular chaperone DnaK (HSP70) [Actinoplanes tereljensis]|uniref:Molecular chaperone DnaK n=1 Tax=Paractinoplanes tereljensis TaxID=571912 RepID=A0A919NYZ7_9ACTN|nr:Hsp70 family protein [Actinoplanes tereljensis]GIF26531.1 molecular chaperone DnaK [Actinoplanes tereljensis]
MPTFGIDLGTTYSCIALVDDTGRPVVVKNAIGEDSTPSVVFFETPDNVVVGREAKNSARIYPDLVVSLIKRRMGEDGVELEFHGARHTPVSISGLILRELAQAAEQIAHLPVRDVVITVPAYFGVKEREATRAAGKAAGLNVLNVVPEPVAAALHYEALDSGTDRTLLVYDLGGGTFDTTVIRISGGDIEVICTDGDHHLGGADWDDRIADFLLQQFEQEHPGSGAGQSEDFLQELATAAEELKRALSSVTVRKHNLRFGDDVTRVEVSRETLERITGDLIEKTYEITQRTVEAARERGITSFDDVLLVGGSTRMPVAAEMLRKRFGFEPKLHDPDQAVAKGAALFALIESVKGAPGSARLADVAAELGMDAGSIERLAAKRVTTVVPRAFGLRVVDEKNPHADRDGMVIDHLLQANTPLPANPPVRHYGTAFEGQHGITLEIWEQAGATESDRPEDNAHIGEGRIDGLPALRKGSPIEVTFAMDEMGTLRMHAIEGTHGKEVSVVLAIAGLTAQEVDEARSAVAKYTVGA